MTKNSISGHLSILAVNVIFGLTVPFMKVLSDGWLEPVSLLAVRAFFAMLIFWLISFFVRKEKVSERAIRLCPLAILHCSESQLYQRRLYSHCLGLHPYYLTLAGSSFPTRADYGAETHWRGARTGRRTADDTQRPVGHCWSERCARHLLSTTWRSVHRYLLHHYGRHIGTLFCHDTNEMDVPLLGHRSFPHRSLSVSVAGHVRWLTKHKCHRCTYLCHSLLHRPCVLPPAFRNEEPPRHHRQHLYESPACRCCHGCYLYEAGLFFLRQAHFRPPCHPRSVSRYETPQKSKSLVTFERHICAISNK